MPNDDKGPVFWHFPPDLIEALVTAIALLNKGYASVLNFFKNAGVSDSLMAPEAARIARKEKINKFEIARNVLGRLNELGDTEKAVQCRRLVARRVAEWENFSTCFADDVLRARGAVSEVQRLINIRDHFTRMQQVQEEEAAERRKKKDADLANVARRVQEYEVIKRDFNTLFVTTLTPQVRGKKAEAVFNALFKHAGIGIREAFSVMHDESGKQLEQIDGVIEINHRSYLVEMKWEKEPLGVDPIVKHIGRIFMRKNSGDIRGMVISYIGFTEPAIVNMKKSKVAGAFIFGCTIFQLHQALENGDNLEEFCTRRITAADVDENPFVE